MMGDTPFPHYLLLPTTEMCSSPNQIVINRPKKMATAKNMVKTKKKQEKMMQKVTQAWFTRTMNTSATSVSRKSSNMKSRNLSGKI